jgi:hypothetical protein
VRRLSLSSSRTRVTSAQTEFVNLISDEPNERVRLEGGRDDEKPVGSARGPEDLFTRTGSICVPDARDGS